MKSLLEIRAVVNASRVFRSTILGGVALASLLATGHVFGQGAYYPVNPPGAPYGSTYTGITVHSNVNLQFLQNELQTLYPGMNLTLQVPLPTGGTPPYSAPTTAQYSATVAACITSILNGQETGTGITISTLSNEAVAWNLAARGTTAGAIAQAIIQVDYTTNSNATQAITDLTTVSQALAISQPTQIDTILPSILAQAQTIYAVAQGIPGIVSTTISQIPTDLTRIASIVGNGISSIENSAATALEKTNLFALSGSSYIFTLINSSAANNNPIVIQTLTQQFASSSSLTIATLSQILTKTINALPAQSNITLAAVTDGALAAQGSASGGPANILSYITTAAPTYTTYVTAVVGGYTNGASRSNLDTYITNNHGYADAIASGAVIKAGIAGNLILEDALNLGVTMANSATNPNPSNVVEEAILANPSSATSTITGAINTGTYTPYGYQVTFGQVALGAAEGAQIQNIGNVVQILVGDTGPITSLPSATVNSIVQNAIDGANNSGNSGAYADIVDKAETMARNTSGISASLVTTAIDEVYTDGGLPYLAAVGAAVGDAYGANRSAIQAAATAALNSAAGGSGAYTAAGTAGLNLVQVLQTESGQDFVNILKAYNTAPNSDAVRADLYAAMMADPNEFDADLAAAIKQSTVPDSTLLTDANNAIRGINSGLSANLQMVDTVVDHIKAEATGSNGPTGPAGVEDLFTYVTHQIVIDSALTNDIAIAATVVDPDHAHYVASAVAFQAPMTVYSSVGPIFEYAQITNPTPYVLPYAGTSNASGAIGTKSFPGSIGTIIDQPAAAAAITAGLTTGILEANLSPANTQTALSTAIASAVAASISQSGTYLQGPTSPFNGTGSGTQFQQSNGTTWNGATPSSNARTVGVAGAITGYMAEVTTNGQTTITTITAAVLGAAVAGGARAYGLQMAQAAGQAFAWVSQNYNTTISAGNPAYDIAAAMATTLTGFDTLAQLENAVAFGISQAQQGVIGAGALGLNATNLNNGNGTLVVNSTANPNPNFYIHRSATGAPVTDIFDL